MSLRPDHKALVFLGAVAALGAGVRVSRAASGSTPSPSAQQALDHQMAAADSAAGAAHSPAESRRSSGRGGAPRVGGRRSASRAPALNPDSAERTVADSLQGTPSRRRRTPPRDGQGYINGRLDLDIATASQIDSLPGVTPTIARRIAADRMRRGPFLSLDGLRRVSGVGPSLAKHLEPLVAFSGALVQGDPQDSTIAPRTRKAKR